MLNVFLHTVKVTLDQWSVGADKTNEPGSLKNHLAELLAAYPALQLLTGDAIFAQRPLLDVLAAEYHVKSVGLEGASGVIDPALFKTYPDRDAANKSAQRLVDRGYLNAGELFAITSSLPVAVYGAEDRTLYRANLKAFRDLLGKKEPPVV